MLGNIGHLLVIISFVSAVVTVLAYFKAQSPDAFESSGWRSFARKALLVHGLAVVGVVVTLFVIIYSNSFEYHYAWSHASRDLPFYYKISCFWEGQEGSFLLWMFWHVVLAVFLVPQAREWEVPVMKVFALVQVFLTSMILGVVIPGIEFKIGSSPFLLLRDAMPEAPVFQMNPDYIPEDGTGLNPLLQNYWMVIHPPTLFLGFAGCLIPFAYAVAGIETGKIKEWIKPAFPWTLFTAMVLGVGIIMGGYWAYETLNFEGYWNWDPVENAVFVPWLTLVAAVHLMTAYGRRPAVMKSLIAMVMVTFILILYSTFLTRSGILGDTSVHSFTDLGLSGQLLLYLLFFVAYSVFFFVKSMKLVPKAKDSVNAYHGEFWIFIGATVLCLSALQVLVPTSIPVFNAIIELFGGESNMAPPAERVEFYTKFQLWFGFAIALFSATGQFFWWRKLDAKKFMTAVSVPLAVTLLISAGIIAAAQVSDWKYILLLTISVYSVASNAGVIFKLAGKGTNLSGGAVAHIGIALMLIGILASSGYSETVSVNNSGQIYSKNFSDEDNRQNVLMFRNSPLRVGEYLATYKGPRFESDDFPGLIKAEDLQKTLVKDRMVAKKDLVHNEKTYFTAGDSLHVKSENTYYEVLYTGREGDEFTLFPRVQLNPQMGGMLPSPDVRHFFGKDLYTHIKSVPNADSEVEWKNEETRVLAVQDTFVVNDFIAKLEDVQVKKESEDEYLFKAFIRVFDRGSEYEARPAYRVNIKNSKAMKTPDFIAATGSQFIIDGVEDKRFRIKIQTTQRDWIILKALEKPYINVLWIGTILMAIGMMIAMFRRYSEWKKVKHQVREEEKTPSGAKGVLKG